MTNELLSEKQRVEKLCEICSDYSVEVFKKKIIEDLVNLLMSGRLNRLSQRAERLDVKEIFIEMAKSIDALDSSLLYYEKLNFEGKFLKIDKTQLTMENNND